MYLDINDFTRLEKEYYKAKFYKFFRNYKKSIKIYLSIIKELLNIESIDQVDISVIGNNILENGLDLYMYTTFEIRNKNLLLFLLFDLFDLYIRDRNVKEIENCGKLLIESIEGFGYASLHKSMKSSMNKVFRRCGNKEILEAFENLIS